MSHLHKDQYKENKELIAYIKGFLCTIEILNEDTGHGQTYYIEEIEKLDTYEQSIIKHLLDKNYKITLQSLVDWKTEFKTKDFFEYILYKTKSKRTGKKLEPIQKHTPTSSERVLTNFGLLHDKFIDLMSELIGDNSKVYEVFVDWDKGAFYECYHKDYLIDNERGLFFLHFGTSD